MKISNLFILVLMALLLTSCIGPREADSIEMKKWVFRHSMGRVKTESICNDFNDKFLSGEISVENFVEGLLSEEDCYDFFEIVCQYIILWDEWEEELNQELAYDRRWAPLYNNPEKTKRIVSNLAHEFDAYLNELAEEQVSVINWNYDEDAWGDTYTGYLVEYEIGNGDYYMLLQLIEYDNKDRYRWQVAYEGTSLIKMQQQYR